MEKVRKAINELIEIVNDLDQLVIAIGALIAAIKIVFEAFT